MKIIQNEFTSDHLIYISYVSINHICELRILTNCRFPFRGAGVHQKMIMIFLFAGNVEVLGQSLNTLVITNKS